jgi:LuxR family quorum-sensing system transcriptional regulator CciR
MDTVSAAAEFARSIPNVVSKDGLSSALADACQRFGIRYFALSHHVDFATAPHAIRVHNYPDGWEEWYDAHRLGLSDPIHRASHFTAQGFYWRDVPRLIPISRSDRQLLGRGAGIGLGDGVTVPAHVPGEARGSCSFVSEIGTSLPEDALLWAQAIGMFAFEGARRLQRRAGCSSSPRVSERQRECIALAGRGFTNRAIARKLGIGEQSVLEHLREARARLGVCTRTELVVSLLAAGELCFDDVARSLP